MPASLRRALFIIFFIGMVSGWAVALNQYLTLIVPAASDDSALTAIVVRYEQTRVAVEADGDRFERLEVYLTGSAKAALDAEMAAHPGPVDGLAIDGQPSAHMLWRAGDQAMIEADFTVHSADVVEQRIGEHLLLTFNGGQWLISDIWRVTLDPGTPLVPLASPGA